MRGFTLFLVLLPLLGEARKTSVAFVSTASRTQRTILQASTGNPNDRNNHGSDQFDDFKNLDRAHMEETLDHAMGDDWRLFRAKLVAQEHREEEETELAVREEGKRLFAAPRRIVSRMASKLRKVFSRRRFDPTHRAPGARSEDPFVSNDEMPIFIPPSPKIDEHFWAHPMSHVEVGSVLVSTDKMRPNSPFHRTVVLILKHSDIPEEETVGLILNKPLHKTLLQVPLPRNPRRGYSDEEVRTQFLTRENSSVSADSFAGPGESQAEYHPSEKPTNLDRTTQVAFWYAPVLNGGHQDSNQYTTMHGFGHVEGSKRIVPGVFCGGSQAFLEGGLTPPMMFIKGHTTWNKRQLQRQIRKKQWVVCSASPEWLLRGASSISDSYYSKIAKAGSNETEVEGGSDHLWADLMASLGGKYAKMVKDRKQPPPSQEQSQPSQPPHLS